MGTVAVDQIGVRGELIRDVDTTLTAKHKLELLLGALPGATVELHGGVTAVRFGDEVIFTKQVTYLGGRWPEFKKRIQIPRRWVDAYWAVIADGLKPRFVGVYHYRDVTIFVDFHPRKYTQRKANNSAAHLATNDLYQAQTTGVFTRTDKGGNTLTSVRGDLFANYLRGHEPDVNPYVQVFSTFNSEFLTGRGVGAMEAVGEMFEHAWPDKFQAEWAGFFLEYRLDAFLRRTDATHLIEFQKQKQRGGLDFDLVFKEPRAIAFYGDLKASNVESREAPGNDATDLLRCVQRYGRFWYVLYEHETSHSRDEGNRPVVEWNEWRNAMGHVQRRGHNPLSYASKFKSAVRFVGMKILEVNEANFAVVLRDFNQGHQPGGEDRAVKVMISKRNIDNFLIYSEAVAS